MRDILIRKTTDEDIRRNGHIRVSYESVSGDINTMPFPDLPTMVDVPNFVSEDAVRDFVIEHWSEIMEDQTLKGLGIQMI